MRKAAAAGTQVNIRLQPDVMKRVDTLRAKVAREPTVAALGRVTRATVIKLAVAKGLEALEARYK